jgi:predicted transcriptional regulator
MKTLKQQLDHRLDTSSDVYGLVANAISEKVKSAIYNIVYDSVFLSSPIGITFGDDLENEISIFINANKIETCITT